MTERITHIACHDGRVLSGRRLSPLSWSMASWLLDQDVPTSVVATTAQLVTVGGIVASDGLFREEPDGNQFIAFYEEGPGDFVFWCPATGELATWSGCTFALGEGNVANPGTYAFDNSLHIYADPLDWLRDRGRGIVAVRWDLAFDMLRDVPRVAVVEQLLPLYRRHMQPSCLPELSVLVDPSRRMAA